MNGGRSQGEFSHSRLGARVPALHCALHVIAMEDERERERDKWEVISIKMWEEQKHKMFIPTSSVPTVKRWCWGLSSHTLHPLLGKGHNRITVKQEENMSLEGEGNITTSVFVCVCGFCYTLCVYFLQCSPQVLNIRLSWANTERVGGILGTISFTTGRPY